MIIRFPFDHAKDLKKKRNMFVAGVFFTNFQYLLPVSSTPTLLPVSFCQTLIFSAASARARRGKVRTWVGEWASWCSDGEGVYCIYIIRFPQRI